MTSQPDHPRSRGVYCGRHWILRRVTGSSPLARGLLGDAVALDDRGRIIPARAGFTLGGPREGVAPQDHPRSRGVYHKAWIVEADEGGSSPLARGLRGRGGARRPRGRIIPARAGFTQASAGAGQPSADHPRSRGVYGRSLRRPLRRSGSSPLARGLLRPARGEDARPGIIPARAGFTTFGGAWGR